MGGQWRPFLPLTESRSNDKFLIVAGFFLLMHRLESLCRHFTAKWYESFGKGLTDVYRRAAARR
jgi:hypothetical protein